MNGFDFEKHKVHLIQKVFEYGFIKDWNLLKEVSLNLRNLDPVTLSYLSTIFKTDKTDLDVTNTDNCSRTYGTLKNS